MKVRLLVPRATINGDECIGDVIETTDAEAVRMIEAGQAEPVRVAKSPEKAVRKARKERAAK